MTLKTLRNVDIAALDTLRVVYRKGSFSAAAEDLDLRQSSVSYTINRLRDAFSDPLFVRQGNRISPTDRCTEIVQTAERIISQLEDAALPGAFDPSATQETVTISATFLSRSSILAGLLRRIRTEAPGLKLELIDGYADAGQQLVSGLADLALSPVSIERSGVHGTVLFTDHYVCLMDHGNPVGTKTLLAQDFARAPHIRIHYGHRWRQPFLDHVEQLGHRINFVVSTPNPEDVRFFLPGTDLIVAMPSRIAGQFAPDLLVRPCPIRATAQLSMFWPARLHRSPLHMWLRDKVQAVTAEVLEDDPVMAGAVQPGP